MREISRLLAILVSALSLMVGTGAADQPESDGDLPAHQVWLVSERWHTSIVLDRANIVASDLLPEASDLDEARFLAFGWGDKSYYMAKDPGLGTALRAALGGTPAVLHVGGLASVPRDRPGNRRVITRPLSAEAFESLVGAISGTFVRSTSAPARPISRGLFPYSYFYSATGEFHLFNTCNTWAARMLQAAGLDVSPDGVVTPEHLTSQF